MKKKGIILTSRGTYTTKPLRLLELKDEGHKLIDLLVGDGIPRVKVYQRLQKRLIGTGLSEHFADLDKMEDCEHVVKKLREWIKQREDTKAAKALMVPKKEKRRRKMKEDVLPWPQQQKAIAAMRKQPHHVPDPIPLRYLSYGERVRLFIKKWIWRN